ncbi:MAG TPA: cation transporter [Actinomycetota bacterium]|jgi:divalent metal cation (Fe/Co/Zn/Cd) transporter
METRHEHAGEHVHDGHAHDGHDHVHHADMDPARRAGLLKRALGLEYFSLAWNVLETVVGLVAGIAAGSVALIGFALDSVVESSSAAALVWRLRNEGRAGWTAEEIEKRAVRIVAWAFFALAAYVGGHAIFDLVTGSRPEESVTGIVLALVSVVVMPLLAARKRAMAKALDSRALAADSSQTSLCTFISVFLLVGLGANAWFGWWWADPVAGLAIALLAAREGRELWTTEHFCAC